MTDTDELRRVIAANPWATLVGRDAEGATASHYAVLLDPEREDLTVVGHVGRPDDLVLGVGNPEHELLVVFQGPHGYIYPAKAEHGKVVPTWNYIAVHARGPVELIEDPERLLRIVSRLSDHHETGRPQPWAVSDAPRDYLDAMLRAIVGFALPIRRLEGKWKLSQNRSVADQAGVEAGLRAESAPGARAVADAMARTR